MPFLTLQQVQAVTDIKADTLLEQAEAGELLGSVKFDDTWVVDARYIHMIIGKEYKRGRPLVQLDKSIRVEENQLIS